MLEALSGQPAPDTLVDAVFSETEGNPFFVDEVFRHLVEEGKVLDDARRVPDRRRDRRARSARERAPRRRPAPGAPRPRRAEGARGRRRGGPRFRVRAARAITDVDDHDVARRRRRGRAAQRDRRPRSATARSTTRSATSSSARRCCRACRCPAASACTSPWPTPSRRLDPDAAVTRPSEIAHHLLQAGAAADVSRTLALPEAGRRPGIRGRRLRGCRAVGRVGAGTAPRRRRAHPDRPARKDGMGGARPRPLRALHRVVGRGGGRCHRARRGRDGGKAAVGDGLHAHLARPVRPGGGGLRPRHQHRR